MTELEELRLAYAECSQQRNELLNKLKHQAQRTWVGLTDDEIDVAWNNCEAPYGFAESIETKLREKNQ